jgi:hypothetical protein
MMALGDDLDHLSDVLGRLVHYDRIHCSFLDDPAPVYA